MVAVSRVAPFYTPTMPRSGRPMSVAMTNCGVLGWFSDRQGYRYQAAHPVTHSPWPPIPKMLLELWAELTAYPGLPEACLVNWYRPGARLGLHRDDDEEDFSAPVLSVSLGDSCLFRLGGLERKDSTRSLRLASGDVMALAGEARLAYHGVDRLIAGSSTLLGRHPDLFGEGGRISLTLRRVTRLG